MKHTDKIAVLGFGVEGRAVFGYLERHGFKNITICDQNVDLKAELPDGVSTKLGKHYLDDLDEFDVIFRSPGIRYLDPHVQLAVQNGVEVTSATNFFMDQCPCAVIGVTGTKGKGTTSTLIYKMLEEGGWKPGLNLFLGGNIGQCPMEFLDKLKGGCLVILELSSFQLQDIKKSPKYVVMLNTTSDHLDYHVDRDEYLRAKEQILYGQGRTALAVLNKDYEYFKYYKPLVKGRLATVSVRGAVKDGAYVKNSGIYFAKKGKVDKVADVSDVALIGSHNLENILSAIVVASELGVSVENVRAVIKKFKNLPYRLEMVRELKGVRYFNDSYSTTPETSMAAVDSFKEPIILIAGGYDKGADYGQWAVKILTKPNLHTVILMGATAEKMEKALVEAEEKLSGTETRDAKYDGLRPYPTKILRRNTMEDAVVDAYAESDEGGVVVLSPAAASFDMYKNYKERGNEFVAQVRKLK